MGEDVEQLEVARKRRFNPFTELSNGHWVLLENLREKRSGWQYEALSCNVLAAFKTEALLNELGQRFISHWSCIERIPWRDKLSVLSNTFDVELKYGERPLQTILEVFRARDDAAHGKPDVLESKEVEKGTREELRRKHPLAQWESLCTVEFAERAYEDTEAFAIWLAAAGGVDDKCLRHEYAAYSMPSKSTE